MTILFAGSQNPSPIVKKISKILDSSAKQEVLANPVTKKALESLPHSASAVRISIEAILSGNSFDQGERKMTIGAFLGYKSWSHKVKTVAATFFKSHPLIPMYYINYEGNLKRPKIRARWTKEKILEQPLEITYSGKVDYNFHQGKRTVYLKSNLSKSQEHIKSVRESEEFSKCNIDALAGRRLSPICLKVRHEAGALDKALFELQFEPAEIPNSRVWSTVQAFFNGKFLSHYKTITPSTPQRPAGNYQLELVFSRAGDVAQARIEHQKGAYRLENIRIPRMVQGIMPVCSRNPFGDWIEQKASSNYAPASCRIDPKIVTTFDNTTYDYVINNCDHVLMMDGSSKIPVAVLTRTLFGEQKAVKVLAGKIKVVIAPLGVNLRVLVNNRLQDIPEGKSFVEKNRSGLVYVKIKHFYDGVFHIQAPNQMLHVITDGKSIEIIAPLLLKGRALGLCGDLNGEQVADLPSPRHCIMTPRLAAMSYMLNKDGKSSNASPLACNGIPQQDLQEYKREEQECMKQRDIPTQITPLLDSFQDLAGGTDDEMEATIGGGRYSRELNTSENEFRYSDWDKIFQGTV